MAFEPTDKKVFEDQLRKNPRLQEAYDLMQDGVSNIKIAKKMCVSPATIRYWFKNATIPARDRSTGLERNRQMTEKLLEEQASGADADDLLDSVSRRAVIELKDDASTMEDESLAELAEAQSTPADKYQHYIAAAGIKLLRDSIKNLRGPKTVRELSELDQLIRRNLGLNAKSGGGSSKMTIDISILNNGIADRGNGTIARMKKDVVEAEVIDGDDE